MLAQLKDSDWHVVNNLDTGPEIKFVELIQTTELHLIANKTHNFMVALAETPNPAINQVPIQTHAVDVQTGGKRAFQFHLQLLNVSLKTQFGDKTSCLVLNGWKKHAQQSTLIHTMTWAVLSNASTSKATTTLLITKSLFVLEESMVSKPFQPRNKLTFFYEI